MKFFNALIQYGMLAFVFLIPWQARLILSEGAINGQYWEYGTRALYGTEVLLFVVLLAVVAKGATHVMGHKPRFSFQRLRTPAGALLFFVAWAGLSVFWSIDRHVALEHWLVIVSGVAVFLILASGAVPFRKLSWAIILSGSIQAIFAFIQFRTQEVIGSTWLGMAYQHASILGASVVETDMMRLLRGYGSFPHPNMLGGWLVLGLLLAVKEVKRTPLAYIAIAALSVGLAVTFSRGAWLAFGVGLAVYILITLIRLPRSLRFLAMTLGVMLVFVGTLAWSYPEPFRERLLGDGRLEAKSIQERSSGIHEALQIIKQHPLTGVGIGNYGLGVHRDLDANQPAYYYQPSHNVPLLMLAELGIIGLVLILWFFLSLRALILKGEAILSTSHGAMLGLLRYARNDKGLVFLISLVIIALFDHYLWSLYAGVMMGAVYLGIFYLKLAKK